MNTLDHVGAVSYHNHAGTLDHVEAGAAMQGGRFGQTGSFGSESGSGSFGDGVGGKSGGNLGVPPTPARPGARGRLNRMVGPCRHCSPRRKMRMPFDS